MHLAYPARGVVSPVALIVFVWIATASCYLIKCSTCDGNDVTCVDGVCLPRCVSVTLSGECLQCLDSRFYGKQCEHDCPDTCLNSRCQMNNTRAVCTEGCVAGKKGDDCGVNCDTACRQCERHGDSCTGPCQNPRYYGQHCRVPCPANCRGGCDKDSGECINCLLGYRGRYCDICEENKDPCRVKRCGTCDGDNVTCVDGVCLPRCVNVTSSGECLQCLDSRFYGKQCEHDCPDTCLNSRCQMDNNRVVCTEGCVAGKKGDNCGVNCPEACTHCERYGDGCTGPCQNPQYYGQNCKTPCPAICTGGCNRITGECSSCEPGYTGVKCGVTCPLNCGDGCDKDTGECIHSGGQNFPFKITTGILAMVILLGIVILILRRFPKCLGRHGSSRASPLEDGAQLEHAVSSGNNHDSDYWTHKYWEIRDRDVLPRKALSAEDQVNPRTIERPLSEPLADTSSSLSLFSAIAQHVKGHRPRSKSVSDVCDLTISPEVHELIKKTDSIIFIEQNCDLSKVTATYLCPRAGTCKE